MVHFMKEGHPMMDPAMFVKRYFHYFAVAFMLGILLREGVSMLRCANGNRLLVFLSNKLMPHSSRLIFAILVGLSGIALPLGAHSADESKDPPKSNQRVVSKNVADALAARMPKYNPPEPEPEPTDEEEMQDMREVDKPRNKIIRLPEYVVRQDKPQVFRERDIYTKAGLKKLAMKRYFSGTSEGLNKLTIPLFGDIEEYALMLYQQDERLKNISDLNETADDIDRVDPESAQKLREATRDTYDRIFDERYRNR
jgi:hypothetical protein